MSPHAREHVKRAHSGRETRGVLAKSTTKSVGSSARTTLYFFLNCAFLFLAPLLICCFTLEIASYGFSLPVSYIVASCLPVSPTDLAGLVASLYFYWALFCVYLVYLKCPHALNIVKYQTFKIPWRFRRDHVSHMRLDRLRRVCQTTPSGRSSIKKGELIVSARCTRIQECRVPEKLFTIFVDIQTAGTISLTVTSVTTVSDIRHGICHLGHSRCYTQEPIYLLGRWRSLSAHETMSDLGVQGLRHFIMPLRVLGGAPEQFTARDDRVVVNSRGWEQCATNPDGTLKDAGDINFGEDPGTPPPAPEGSGSRRRPARGKNPHFADIIAAEGERIPGEKSNSKRKRGPTKGKAKASESGAEESEFSGGSESDSDSDAGAEITHEELAESLPSKTVPQGLTGHLKNNAPEMYQLFLLMNANDRKPTSEEIEVAQGKKTFATDEQFAEWLEKLSAVGKVQQQSLREAFARAAEKRAATK
ncbi:hypothetical protein C8R45DRAFT_922158 [Mycena sanguinolenta]|nr:hypothetical protein C8R45DRAFT_922158 [Mycena sanguinolenta]